MNPYIKNDFFRTSNSSYKLNEKQIYRPEYTIDASSLKNDNFKWILAEIYFDNEHPLPENDALLVISFENKIKNIGYYAKNFKNHSKISDKWNYCYILAPIPTIITEQDIMKCYIWNYEGKTKNFIDDFRVIAIK
jgi:hypothetical protein